MVHWNRNLQNLGFYFDFDCILWPKRLPDPLIVARPCA